MGKSRTPEQIEDERRRSAKQKAERMTRRKRMRPTRGVRARESATHRFRKWLAVVPWIIDIRPEGGGV